MFRIYESLIPEINNLFAKNSWILKKCVSEPPIWVMYGLNNEKSS